MSAELERVYEGEVVEEEDPLQECAGLWTSGAAKTLWGKLEMALGAARYAQYYGRGWADRFASEVRAKSSKVYIYGKVGHRFGQRIADGDPDFSARVESGLVSMSMLYEAARTPDPMKTLDSALDEHKSARQMEAESKEDKELEAANHPKAEKVEAPSCPSCGAPSTAWERPPLEVSSD